jgi:hypothetical protein
MAQKKTGIVDRNSIGRPMAFYRAFLRLFVAKNPNVRLRNDFTPVAIRG